VALFTSDTGAIREFCQVSHGKCLPDPTTAEGVRLASLQMLRRSSGPYRRGGAYRARHMSLGIALGLVIASVALGVSAGPAVAAPQNDLANATAQATQLEQQIAANSHRADVLDEQYLQAQAAVAAANRRIVATQRQISATATHADQLHRRLGSRAALLYMGAGSNDPIGIDVTNVQDLGSRAKYGDAAAAQDQRTLDDLKVTNEQLHAQRNDLDHQLSAAHDQQRAAQNARRQVAQINDSMQNLLNSTKSNIRTLAAKIEQQRRAAAAVAVQARIQQLSAQQAAAQAAATQTTGNSGSATSSPSATNIGTTLANLPAPSGGAAAAVAYARAQLGKPYVYAGVGPDSFDCSGLTMMAWRQGGVSMDHGSRSQYDSFPHVPLSQLQPGDLVFFGPSGPMNGHVGMVVGPGMMIDAPHTGAFVELVSYYWPDLVPMGARP
jgi:peptidoglycan DL-endopeptidase CwlO